MCIGRDGDAFDDCLMEARGLELEVEIEGVERWDVPISVSAPPPDLKGLSPVHYYTVPIRHDPLIAQPVLQKLPGPHVPQHQNAGHVARDDKLNLD